MAQQNEDKFASQRLHDLLNPGTEAYFENCICSCQEIVLDYIQNKNQVSVNDIHYLDFMPWRRKIIRAAFDDLEEKRLIIQVASLEILNDYNIKYRRTNVLRIIAAAQ